MKQLYKYILLAVTIASFAVGAMAQDNSTSTSVLRRGGSRDRNKGTNPQTNVTERMQSRMAETPVSDADLSWMRVVYRQLDLTKDKNTPLYFPEEPTEGQESLFRIIMRLLANDQLIIFFISKSDNIYSFSVLWYISILTCIHYLRNVFIS